MDLVQLVLLVVSILICEAAGLIGSIWTRRSLDDWYRSLEKPDWTPSGRTIGVIWTILFLLMGIALYIVLNEGIEDRAIFIGTILFGIQLIINILWSYAFFGRRSPAWGLATIVVLWLAVLATLVQFWTISWLAGALLVPYFIWVTVAGSLNVSLYELNKNA